MFETRNLVETFKLAWSERGLFFAKNNKLCDYLEKNHVKKLQGFIFLRHTTSHQCCSFSPSVGRTLLENKPKGGGCKVV